MKKRNAVVGMKVQVKRDCCGHSDELIKGGLVCIIGRIDSVSDDYELRLEHPDIDGGWAWVNASDVRRYIEPTESPEPVIEPEPVVEPDEPLTKGTRVQVKSTLVGEWGERLQEGDVYILQDDEDTSYDGTRRRINVRAVAGSSAWSTQPKYFDVLPDEVPEEPQDDIKVGDSVLVGAEGAGNNYVLKGYAGLVCSVVDTSYRDDCVEISHPDVMSGLSYTSRKEYLTKVTSEPTLEYGDIIELREACTAKHGELIPKGLYMVGCVDKSDDTCEVLTVHGGLGQATLPMAKVRKVGVCNVTSG